MFGHYNNTFELKYESFNISVSKQDSIFIYRRKTALEFIEKAIAVENCQILINPVEPLNTPKKISNHLMIALNVPLLLEPKTTKKIYIKFPIEFGVFLTNDLKNIEIIDIFTLSKNKFTLYGDLKDGIICKYYKSDVFLTQPDCSPIYEGIIELDVSNKTAKYVTVSMVIFNSFGMRIYYNNDRVFIKASMLILNEGAAEVDFDNISAPQDMIKSYELYLLKMMSMTKTSFTMEWGL
ncbi:MAG: DUF432 domain-containing protein [Nitrospirae bacterium]|nr:DUF432 domain-containing protein [Nitrospirota bacterium]MBF0540931.1 DUF432 domain-containing protein [Nitrospirota bacterium]